MDLTVDFRILPGYGTLLKGKDETVSRTGVVFIFSFLFLLLFIDWLSCILFTYLLIFKSTVGRPVRLTVDLFLKILNIHLTVPFFRTYNINRYYNHNVVDYFVTWTEPESGTYVALSHENMTSSQT